MTWGRRTRDEANPLPLLKGGATEVEDQATASLLARLVTRTDDDLAIARNWRRLIARPPTRQAQRGAVFATALTAFLLALALGFWRTRAATVSSVDVVATSGGVLLIGRNAGARTGAAGEALHEGQRVRTDDGGQVLLRTDGVAALLLEPGSDVTLEQLTGGCILRLSSGGVVARVSKRPPGEPFIVLTDRYAITVVGTLFSVRQGPGDRIEVSVREGTVAVSENAVEIARVTAGSRWKSDAPSCAADQTSDQTAHLLQTALVAATSTASAQRELDLISTAHADSIQTALAIAEVSPPRSEKPVVRLAARTAHHRVTPMAPVPTVNAPPMDYSAVAVSVPTPPAPAPVAPPADYGHAISLQAAGNYRGAAEELARAADLDRHAELALYSLGRLRLRHLADPEGALAAFRRYREHYADGTLLPDVDLSIFEIEASLGRRAQALAEGEHYLAAHPDSGKSDQVHLVRAHLMRDAGDCAGALQEYALIRSEALADEATYATAYCQRKLGDRSAATKTLRLYLARFPGGSHSAEARGALDDAKNGL